MLRLFYFLLLMPGLFRIFMQPVHAQLRLNGAWARIPGDHTSVKCLTLFGDRIFMQTQVDTTTHHIVFAGGGVYTLHGDTLDGEFLYQMGDKMVQPKHFQLVLKGNPDELNYTSSDGKTHRWKRLDNGQGTYAGTWRIVQHMQNGQLRDIPQSGDRKTLKLLTATHFQWAAFNKATGQLYATGGGTYTLSNGQYIEHIEFFSRDSTRVGMSLPFEDEIKGDQWYHKGKTTKGDPNFEVWRRVEE
jgi:DNA-binding beta-propeller fold protein YncE